MSIESSLCNNLKSVDGSGNGVCEGVGISDGVAVMPVVAAGGGAGGQAEESDLKLQQLHQFLIYLMDFVVNYVDCCLISHQELHVVF